MPSLRYLVLSLAVLLLGGCNSNIMQTGALTRAHYAIRDGHFESALARLSEAEGYSVPSPEIKAEIAFLRAQCHEGLKRLPEAIGTYRYIVSTSLTANMRSKPGSD